MEALGVVLVDEDGVEVDEDGVEVVEVAGRVVSALAEPPDGRPPARVTAPVLEPVAGRAWGGRTRM